MAVFKQELNWSTYQEKQLRVLTSIEQSFASGLKTSRLIEDNLSKMSHSMDSMVANTRALTNFLYKMNGPTDTFSKNTTLAASSMADVNRTLTQQKVLLDQYGKTILDTQKLEETRQQSMQRLEEEQRNSILENLRLEEEERNSRKKSGELFVSLLGDMSGMVSTLGRAMNTYSTISNQMMTVSGLDGNSVRNFRSDLVDIVSDLNKETGGYYNPQEAYKQVVSISQGVTSNLDAIKEMTKPLLLTQETLDVNIGSIAHLFNKFYTRYNFTSIEMESMIDEIRSNTAGNSANAEATIANINSLEGWISQYASGDSKRLEEMMESISHYTSWLESMGVDSAKYTENLNSIAWGDARQDKGLLQILNAAGSSVDEAQAMLQQGMFEQVTELLAQGEAAIFNQITASSGGKLTGIVADARGISRSALDTANAFNSENYVGLGEFVNNYTTDTTATDIVADKYTSLSDKMYNKVDEITHILSSIQENLGIGLSDLTSGLALALSVQGLVGKYGSLVPSIGGAGAATATGGGMLSAGMSTLSGAGASMLGIGAAALPYIAGAAAIAGVVGLGVAAYKDATELTGNAKLVAESFEGMRESLKDENIERLNSLAQLKQNVADTDDIETKRELMAKAGISTQERLNTLEEDALNNLIDAHINSAKEINASIDVIVEGRKKLVETEQHGQQKEFINSMISKINSGELSGKDLEGALETLMAGVTDADLLKKYQKALKDGSITKKEAKDLLDGGANKWFDKNNLMDKGVDISAMENADTLYTKTGMAFTHWDAATETAIADLYTALMYKYNTWYKSSGDAKKVAKEDLLSYIESSVRGSEYLDGLKSNYGSQLDKIASDLGIEAFAEGTTYVPRTQFALVHEGEAVVPRKYNPYAGMTSLQEQMKARQDEIAHREDTAYMEETIGVLHEIKEFLAVWKKDNEKNETINQRKSALSTQSALLSRYLSNA